MIFTIGYQALTKPALHVIVEALDATLIDVRSSPRSRIPGFGFKQLEEDFAGRYVQLGHCLGGREPGVTGEGLRWLQPFDDQRKHANCILMCLEHDPWDCHRHNTITAPHFPRAQHIIDGLLYTSKNVQAKLDGKAELEAAGAVLPDDE